MRNQHGVTLTELTVVMVLASLVMIGIVGFYLNSQGMWMDSSAQAIAQREGSQILLEFTDSVHVAGHAEVVASPDAEHSQLELFRRDTDATPFYVFWWDVVDSLIHEGPSRAGDRGRMGSATVTRFQCVPDPNLVRIELEFRSAQGHTIAFSTAAALINRRPPPGP